MAVYEQETRVRAPLEPVWEFHATTDGLEALTPEWLGLRVESVTGPDGEPDPAELFEGSTIDLSVRPFGVGPRQRVTSVIERRERSDGAGLFCDRMIGGPFAEWKHTHAFYADGDGAKGGDETIVRDHVEYRLPLGPVGSVVARAMVLGFAPAFRHRHRRTRAILEG
ncbi:SRPBCC family protein [Salinarchaeum chitinilyticum]